MANSVNREYGHYRRPVGGSRTVVSSEATGRWTREAVAGHACGFERGILGVTHRRSLARSAVSLSALSNLSSTIPNLAAQRVADTFTATTCRGFTRPREARSERILHRRQLQRREKGGSGVGPTKRGKGSKIMAIADGHGLPLAVHVASASPHETKLVEATLEQRFFADLPERLIGDRAYDSDRLDERLMQHYGIEMIAPHTSMRTRTLTQDGRVLRRYRRRWKVERLFAWLHNYRRIVVRWERYPENFLGMIHLASAIILLRHL